VAACLWLGDNIVILSMVKRAHQNISNSEMIHGGFIVD